MSTWIPYVIVFDVDDDRLFLAELASNRRERRTTLAEKLEEFGGYEGAVSSPSGASQRIDLSSLGGADPQRTALAIVFRDEAPTESGTEKGGLLESGVLDDLEPGARSDLERLLEQASEEGPEGGQAAAALRTRLHDLFGAGIEDPIKWEEARQIAHGVSLIDCRTSSDRPE